MKKIKVITYLTILLTLSSTFTLGVENTNKIEENNKNICITFYNSVSSFNLKLFQQNQYGNEVKGIYTPGGEDFTLTTYGINLNIYNFSLALSKTIKTFPSYFEPEKVEPEIININPIFSQKEWAIKLFYYSYKGFYLTQPELSDFYFLEKRRENLKYIDIGTTFEFNLKPVLSKIFGREIENYFDFSKFYNYSYATGFDYNKIKDLPISAFFDVIGIIGGISFSYTNMKDDNALIITPHYINEGIKKLDIYHTEAYISVVLPFASENEAFFGNIGFSTSLGIGFGNAETNIKKENIFGITTKIPGFITIGYNVMGYLIARFKFEYENVKLPLFKSNHLSTETVKLSVLLTISF